MEALNLRFVHCPYSFGAQAILGKTADSTSRKLAECSSEVLMDGGGVLVDPSLSFPRWLPTRTTRSTPSTRRTAGMATATSRPVPAPLIAPSAAPSLSASASTESMVGSTTEPPLEYPTSPSFSDTATFGGSHPPSPSPSSLSLSSTMDQETLNGLKKKKASITPSQGDPLEEESSIRITVRVPEGAARSEPEVADKKPKPEAKKQKPKKPKGTPEEKDSSEQPNGVTAKSVDGKTSESDESGDDDEDDDEENNSETPKLTRCICPRSVNWKRLRLKKGVKHYLCRACGAKWKVRRNKRID